MAKCKILMQTAQVQKMIDYFDGFSDDKVSVKFLKKTGIKAEMEVETELSPDEAAAHLKGIFKKTKEGSYMYYSIQPDGFFG
jgi:hypothetical protein